ncbi:helix-turn-helix domain-containing protein [Nocardia sp. SYP-A9097]|uniref:MmyB family transcriptional regulator n=1 Tax=Nocardia sp. SYP-A9097 TaxID=2663237 RepID=UPI001890CFE0|nr:helix-turn-helix domain-containing protein [Nocardia sp. SYP-A9097]
MRATCEPGGSRRESAGLTRAELARRAGVSEALIQKVEQGTRQATPTALGALFQTLEVPVQYIGHVTSVLLPELAGLVTEGGYPERLELDFLNSLPYPAGYQTMPAMDLLAANDAYRKAFPGLDPGTNIIAWMLLDPIARYVMRDWEREAHMMVYMFRHASPGVTAPERIEEITRLCSKSPDWQRFWDTEIPPNDIHRRPTQFLSPETGDWITMQMQVFRCEMPHRPWYMYTLTPVPDEI